MGRLNFGQPAAPPVTHDLHDDDANVIDEDVAKAVYDGLLAEPKPTLPVGCTWRVPLTRVHNPSDVLLLYRDQLDAQTLDQVMVYVKIEGSIVISFIFTSTLLTSSVNV